MDRNIATDREGNPWRDSKGRVSSIQSVVDTDNPTGADVAESVGFYFSNSVPSSSKGFDGDLRYFLTLPEMYFRTDAKIDVDPEKLNRLVLLRLYYDTGNGWDCERAPMTSLLVGKVVTDSLITLTFRALLPHSAVGENGNPMYLTLDETVVVEYPNSPFTEILAHKCEDPGASVEVLGKDESGRHIVCTPYKRVIDLFGNYRSSLADPNAGLQTMDELAGMFGDAFAEYIYQRELNTRTPEINGSPSYSLSIIDALPDRVSLEGKVFTRLEQTRQKVRLPMEHFCGTAADGRIRFDLIHHYGHTSTGFVTQKSPAVVLPEFTSGMVQTTPTVEKTQMSA